MTDELRVHGEITFNMDSNSLHGPDIGDWVASERGDARYLVMGARAVNRRTPTPGEYRYRLTCAKLDQGLDPPADVFVWWFHWYGRKPRRW